MRISDWSSDVCSSDLISMRACLQEVNKARGDRSLWQWFRGSRQAELVVIFGEDLAALLGLVFALAAVLLAVATGNPVWDAIGTIGIGALLIVDRKSTRLNSITNAHLVCRLLLEKKN